MRKYKSTTDPTPSYHPPFCFISSCISIARTYHAQDFKTFVTPSGLTTSNLPVLSAHRVGEGGGVGAGGLLVGTGVGAAVGAAVGLPVSKTQSPGSVYDVELVTCVRDRVPV